MVNNLLYNILQASLTVSLSNREVFIDKVSKIIEQKLHRDPESARHLSNQLTGAMEGLNGTLLLKQLFSSRSDKQLNHTLRELTTAVENLNTLLKEAGLPDPSAQFEKPCE